MTDPRHLDDEALSAVLDGEDVDAGVHLAGCGPCSARVGALRAARDAVAGASVPPLAAPVVDDLVAAALASPTGAATAAPVLPMGSAARRGRGRRLSGPPPAWLIGAAAGIAGLAGLAGLLGSATGGGDDAAVGDAAGRFETTTADEEAGGGAVPSGGATGVTGDPEAVTRDLGDLDDPHALAAAVSGAPTTIVGAARAAGGGSATESESKDTDQDAASSSPAPVAGPVTGGSGAGTAPDRAQCRADAERIGAGRLGALLSTATLRWAGRPAEVLVFALTEPAGGVSRQALVLARPGCALLADPRF